MRFKGAQAFVCFSFWLRVLDKAEYSAFESTLNSSIVSYHTRHERYDTKWKKSLMCPPINSTCSTFVKAVRKAQVKSGVIVNADSV